jgi:hypothetical protein
MTAIGLSGFAQSGKTTAAKYLEEKYGFERHHIAETLRAMLAVLLKNNGIPSDMITRYLEGDLKETVIPQIGKSGRELQISIGTEWGRELVHPDLWANTWAALIGRGHKAMNDSVRFPNEEGAIKDLGGFTVLIKRPGTGPVAFKWGKIGKFLFDTFGLMWGVHDSERTDRLKPTYIIHNDGDVQALYDDLDEAIAAHFSHRAATSFVHGIDHSVSLGLAGTALGIV